MLLITRLGVLAAFCAAASLYDLRQGRVPNPLNAAGLLCGLCIGAAAGGARGLGQAALGALVGVGVLALPFLLGMVGGGDLKFLAAAGSMLGWRATPVAFMAGAALGGLMGIVHVARGEGLSSMKTLAAAVVSGVWKPSRIHAGRAPGSSARLYDSIPYVIPLAFGVVIAASASAGA